MNAPHFTEPVGGCGPGVGRSLNSADVSSHKHRDETRAGAKDLRQQSGLGGLEHNVGRRDGGDKADCLDHSNGIHG